MDDAMNDAPHDYRYSPAPSPPSMVAAPCEAATLDKLSVIAHHLRRSPALLNRVFAAVQADQQRIRDGEPVERFQMGTVESESGRVELSMSFPLISWADEGECIHCECDE